MTLDDAPPVLTVAQVAEVALTDPRTVRGAIHRGELHALITGVRGRVIRVHRDAVREWLFGSSVSMMGKRRTA